VLAEATRTSLRGTIWGAVVTLLVQSSSATTMTTIGLVSAGLLTFPQGLSLVLGANIGTTGTGWLVALLGVRISLTAYALPIVFAGALLKLIGKGRWAAPWRASMPCACSTGARITRGARRIVNRRPLFDHQNRNRTADEDLGGLAAEQKTAQATTAVRGHGD